MPPTWQGGKEQAKSQPSVLNRKGYTLQGVTNSADRLSDRHPNKCLSLNLLNEQRRYNMENYRIMIIDCDKKKALSILESLSEELRDSTQVSTLNGDKLLSIDMCRDFERKNNDIKVTYASELPANLLNELIKEIRDISDIYNLGYTNETISDILCEKLINIIGYEDGMLNADKWYKYCS